MIQLVNTYPPYPARNHGSAVDIMREVSSAGKMFPAGMVMASRDMTKQMLRAATPKHIMVYVDTIAGTGRCKVSFRHFLCISGMNWKMLKSIPAINGTNCMMSMNTASLVTITSQICAAPRSDTARCIPYAEYAANPVVTVNAAIRYHLVLIHYLYNRAFNIFFSFQFVVNIFRSWK